MSCVNLQGAPILLHDGNVLKGGGLSSDPEWCDQFRTALSHQHEKAHDLVGSYVIPCEPCSEAWKEHRSGCDRHSNSPRTCRTGNATKSALFKDTIQFIKNNSTHQRNGAKQLLPSEVRDIGQHCINSNDAFLCMMFVLLLLAIDLFLRKIEFQSLHLDNFVTELFVMRQPYIVDALNVKVKGKKKKTKKKGASMF